MRAMTRSSSPRPNADGAKAGGPPALDIFALRNRVVQEYGRFAKSFTTIHAPDIREQVEAIYAEERYWPEPLIQINPSYKRSTDVGALVESGVLARISHQLSSRGRQDAAVVGRTPESHFDGEARSEVSATPSVAFGPCGPLPRHLGVLATKVGEKSGLALPCTHK